MKNKLEAIKNRYFRPVMKFPEGHLCHYADCSIYRSVEVYGTAACTCGLLHDLSNIKPDLMLKIYPFYYEELLKEDGILSQNKEDIEYAKTLVEKIFKNPLPMTSEAEYKESVFINPLPLSYEKEEAANKDWELIESIFGKGFRERNEKEWFSNNNE